MTAGMVLLMAWTSVWACAEDDGSAAGALKVATAEMRVAQEKDGPRIVTTLGTLKNESANPVDEVVIEVSYFDGKGKLVDTLSEAMYGLVIPPGEEVAFRVRGTAAAATEAYASQKVRVLTASTRYVAPKKPAQPTFGKQLMDFLVSWGPMLLLITVWVFFMRKVLRKDSPQNKTLALMEKQVAMLEVHCGEYGKLTAEQNRLLERLVAALERKD